jgi:transcriptional regulator with XRE-family HTH domain
MDTDLMKGTEIRAVLAKNIKAFRGRRNWSQADLAEKTGLSIVYLSDIERGNKWPYLDTLVKLAEALEIEVFELLMPENAPASANISALTKYTAEINAIFAKSMETMEKDTKKALVRLRNQYISKT